MNKFLFFLAMLMLPFLVAAQDTPANNVTSLKAVSAADDVSNLSNANKQGAIKGALCYIQADDQVVFVDEIYTKRLSLPGGTIEAGEDPAKTAEREAWEETGIVVEAKEVLTQTDTAIIYHCEPASGVIAFAAQDSAGFHHLPAWYAPSFSIEIKQVLLGFPGAIDAQTYRYPEQFEQQVLGHDVRNAPIQYIQSAESAAPSVHRMELSVIQQLQTSLFSMSDALNKVVIYTFKGINLVASLVGVLFLLPILLLMIDGKYFNRMMFLAVGTGMVCLLIQFGLKYPRPFIYQPMLQLTDAVGFGTPSIRSALAIVLIGYFYRAWNIHHKDEPINKTLIGFIVLMLLQGFAGVLLGEQFASDVLFGFMIGLFALWHFIRMENTFAHRDDIFKHPALWWGMFVIASLFAFYLHSLQMANITAVALAMALVRRVLLSSKAGNTSHVVLKLLACWCVGLIFTGLQFQWFDSFNIGSSMMSYFMQSGLWFALSYIIISISSMEFKTKESSK